MYARSFTHIHRHTVFSLSAPHQLNSIVRCGLCADLVKHRGRTCDVRAVRAQQARVRLEVQLCSAVAADVEGAFLLVVGKVGSGGLLRGKDAALGLLCGIVLRLLLDVSLDGQGSHDLCN